MKVRLARNERRDLGTVIGGGVGGGFDPRAQGDGVFQRVDRRVYQFPGFGHVSGAVYLRAVSSGKDFSFGQLVLCRQRRDPTGDGARAVLHGHRYLGVSRAGPLRGTAPLFTMALAFFVFSERPGPFVYAGAILTVLGTWLVSYRR